MNLRKLSLFALALVVLCVTPLFAAELPLPDGGDPTVTPPPAVDTDTDAAAGDDADAGPRVVCAYVFSGTADTPECPEAGKRGTAYLGDRLSVRVAGLDAWLADEEKETADLRLFLDGVEITDLAPEAVQAVEGEEGTTDVRFRLLRDADNRDAWRTLLGPFQLAARAMSAGVGLGGEQELAGSSSARIDLQAVHVGWFKFYAVLLFAFLIFFFAFWRTDKSGKKRKLTDSLRDAQAEGTPKPFSLARCQMAWWFFLVIAAYVFLWLVLGDLDTITGSVLTLMGVGSGTALGAAMIDGGKKAGEEQAEAEVDAAKAMTPATATATPEAQARLATAQAKLENVKGAVKQGSRGVLADILSDGNGYSFHRFQIAVWTLILGIIFVVSVWKSLAMPEFSDTLLGLMGISSGTYLGFKFPERFQ